MTYPFCADVQNSCIQAPSSEKHYIICSPTFGLKNEGKIAIIVRSLYGRKSAGTDYWSHVRDAMANMHFKYCKADPYI